MSDVSVTPPPWMALFRGMNLGHRGSPTRAQLEAAFLEAGAATVRSFQTNGTVLFTPAGRRGATALLNDVRQRLTLVDGDRPVIVRSVDDVAAAVSSPVWGEHAHADIYREIVSFFDLPAGRAHLQPYQSLDDRLIFLAIDATSALSLVRQIGASIGDPNAALEGHHGALATSRTRGTLQRLLAAAAYAH